MVPPPPGTGAGWSERPPPCLFLLLYSLAFSFMPPYIRYPHARPRALPLFITTTTAQRRWRRGPPPLIPTSSFLCRALAALLALQYSLHLVLSVRESDKPMCGLLRCWRRIWDFAGARARWNASSRVGFDSLLVQLAISRSLRRQTTSKAPYINATRPPCSGAVETTARALPSELDRTRRRRPRAKCRRTLALARIRTA